MAAPLKNSQTRGSKNITKTESAYTIEDRLDILAKALVLVGEKLTVQIMTMHDQGGEDLGIIIRGAVARDGRFVCTVNLPENDSKPVDSTADCTVNSD